MVPRLTKKTSTDEKTVVNSHSNELPYEFLLMLRNAKTNFL